MSRARLRSLKNKRVWLFRILLWVVYAVAWLLWLWEPGQVVVTSAPYLMYLLTIYIATELWHGWLVRRGRNLWYLWPLLVAALGIDLITEYLGGQRRYWWLNCMQHGLTSFAVTIAFSHTWLVWFRNRSDWRRPVYLVGCVLGVLIVVTVVHEMAEGTLDWAFNLRLVHDQLDNFQDTAMNFLGGLSGLAYLMRFRLRRLLRWSGLRGV